MTDVLVISRKCATNVIPAKAGIHEYQMGARVHGLKD